MDDTSHVDSDEEFDLVGRSHLQGRFRRKKRPSPPSEQSPRPSKRRRLSNPARPKRDVFKIEANSPVGSDLGEVVIDDTGSHVSGKDAIKAGENIRPYRDKYTSDPIRVKSTPRTRPKDSKSNLKQQDLPTRRSTRSATMKKGKAAQIVHQGRGWAIIEEDVTTDEESARSSIDQRASTRASRSQARRSPDVYTPAKVQSKRRSPVKKIQPKKIPRRVKPTSPTLSSPSNTFASTDQSEATTDVGSDSEIDLGAETDTTSYSLKFCSPLVAQSPRSTVSSLAIPVPSDFETDVEEPEEYTPAIRQSSVGTLSIMDDIAEDDPEMELDHPDFRPVTSQSRVLRGPLPHHLYPFVPLQKKAVLQRLRNPPSITLGGEKATNEAEKELRGLLEGTMDRGEGNSCLVLGPRGSGKSLVRLGFLTQLW